MRDHELQCDQHATDTWAEFLTLHVSYCLEEEGWKARNGPKKDDSQVLYLCAVSGYWRS